MFYRSVCLSGIYIFSILDFCGKIHFNSGLEVSHVISEPGVLLNEKTLFALFLLETRHTL